MAGVIREIWASDIQNALYRNAAFLSMARNHDSFVLNRKVYVPQAGGGTEIVIGQTQLPAPVGERVDTALEYDVETFRILPQAIQDFDAMQVSYDMRQSVMSEQMNLLAQTVGDYTLNKWSSTAAANIIRTTGSAVATALAPSATGTRKAVTGADIRTLAKILDEQNVPIEGRKIIMSVGMYYQLFDDNDFKSTFIIGNVPTLPNGIISRIYGFDVTVRPVVSVYDGSAVKKAYGAAGATSDNLSCIAYHPDFVAKAQGALYPRLDADKPEYYGSIFSLEQFFGASQLRTSQVGIAQLVQTT